MRKTPPELAQTRAKKFQRERQEWMDKANHRYNRSLEEAEERLSQEANRYWRDHYEARNKQLLEQLTIQNREHVARINDEFRAKHQEILSKLREQVVEESRKEQERIYAEKFKVLVQQTERMEKDWRSALKQSDAWHDEARKLRAAVEELKKENQMWMSKGLEQQSELEALRKWKEDAMKLMSKHGILDPKPED